jgi:hypothetical protein
MRRAAIPLSTALMAVICAAWVFAGPASQSPSSIAREQQSDREYIANLATGRVIVCVTRESVLVGAVSEESEPGAHPPLFIPLNGGHVAVLLGAVEWIELNSGKPSIRLDTALADVAGHNSHPAVYAAPNESPEKEAGDIEGIGIAFLERLREIVGKLHHPLNLKSDEPIVQIVIAGYELHYGPEAWLVSYRVQQRELKDDYWDTLVQRPSYTQLYPPEKGEPRTLIEVRYPADIKGPTFLQLLGRNDARLIPVRSSDPKVGQAAQLIFDGASNRAASDPATIFVKGAIIATITPENKPALAILREDDKFDWVIPPPETFKKAEDEKRDPTAPTLRAPHHQ